MKGVFIPEISVEILKNASLDTIEDFFSRILNDGNVAIWDAELPQWIPVTKRLPEDVEEGEEYPIVIYCAEDYVSTGYYDYITEEWWDTDGYPADAIAWMPLPEPYKEKENDI